jgi:hypothetical protein
MRGLPLDEDLQKTGVADIFSEVLCNGSIVRSDSEIENDQTELRTCYHHGWLHADKTSGDKIVYVFPSPLHRLFLEWKLQKWDDPSPFDSNSLLELAVDVIKRFSPTLLSERRIGPGCIQRPQEAQFQDEFYRCCYARSNGSLVAFPEFGTGKGRVDFFIPYKKWGVELLREGDRLQQHYNRFSPDGSYGKTLRASDYIVLDCRTTRPKLRHEGVCIICLSIYFPFFSS